MTRADATAIAQQYQAGRIADLNQWIALTDATSTALGLANERDRVPENLPENHTKPADLLARARALVARLEALQ